MSLTACTAGNALSAHLDTVKMYWEITVFLDNRLFHPSISNTLEWESGLRFMDPTVTTPSTQHDTPMLKCSVSQLNAYSRTLAHTQARGQCAV